MYSPKFNAEEKSINRVKLNLYIKLGKSKKKKSRGFNFNIALTTNYIRDIYIYIIVSVVLIKPSI